MKLSLRPVKINLQDKLVKYKPKKDRFAWFRDKLQHESFQSVLIITFFLMFSRGLGFVRNILIYQKMDKDFSDLFIEATKIPDLITSILIMGTVVSAVLPVASRLNEKFGKETMVRFLNLFHVALIAVVSLAIVLTVVFLEPVVKLTVSQESLDFYLNNNLYNDFLWVNRILLLGPLIFAMQNLLAVFLNIQKKFLAFSLSASIYNLGPVVGLLISGRNDYFTLVISMMISGLVSVLFYYIVARKDGYFSSNFAKITETYNLYKVDFYKTWIAFLPRLFLLNGMIVANQLINKVQDTSGQVTAFDIGLSIQGIFLVLIISIGTVLFPDLASTWNKKGQQKQFFTKLFTYNRNLLSLGFLGFLGTYFMVYVVMWFFELFGKGQGNSDYIILIVQVLSFALIFQSVTDIVTKYFYVRERVWEPVVVYFLAGFVQICMTFYFASTMDAGVAVSLGLLINVVLVYILAMMFIWRDYKYIEKYEFKIG